jgi:hypothetical protein
MMYEQWLIVYILISLFIIFIFMIWAAIEHVATAINRVAACMEKEAAYKPLHPKRDKDLTVEGLQAVATALDRLRMSHVDRTQASTTKDSA